MRKRILLAATWAGLLASTGCLRNMCEKHGYYPAAPACAPQCCVPCCPGPTAGYVAPAAAAPSWNAPAVAGSCPQGCVPAGR